MEKIYKMTQKELILLIHAIIYVNLIEINTQLFWFVQITGFCIIICHII